MTSSSNRFTLALPLALALALTSACGQQDVDPEPSPTASVAEPSPAATEAAAASAPSEDDEARSSGASGDTAQEQQGANEQTQAEARSEVRSEVRTLEVADEPTWTAPGQLLGVYGDVAVVAEGRPAPGHQGGGPVTVTAYLEDGSTVWQRALTVPDQLVGVPEVSADARPGHRRVLLTWSGTPAGADRGVVVAVVVDPSTGEDVAAGEVEVPAGESVHDQITYDEFFLSGSSVILTVGAAGTLTVDDGADGYDEPVGGAAWRVMHDLGVTVDEDGRLQLVDEEGPVGKSGGPCPVPEGPGGLTALALSPNRDLALFPGAVMDLVDGSVTCVELAHDQARVLTDSGVATFEPDPVPRALFDRALLGGLLLTSTDDGVDAFAVS